MSSHDYNQKTSKEIFISVGNQEHMNYWDFLIYTKCAFSVGFNKKKYNGGQVYKKFLEYYTLYWLYFTDLIFWTEF